jgi:iron complex transport system substrate-binding protein
MSKIYRIPVILIAFMLMLVACAPAENNDTNNDSTNTDTVEITDAHGTQMVPVNPKNVVSLDNRTFETLDDWGIELVAAPIAVMPSELSYVSNDSILDIGNHRDPKLELIAAANPDVVIVGQRFASYYEDIKALVPNAIVIDLNIDVSENTDSPGENLVNGFIETTTALGKIFDKNAEAETLITEFNTALENTKNAYNGSDTIMSVIVSGGEIGYSAPGSGRIWGPLYEIFDWVSPLEVEDTTSDHQGDDISTEAIAQSNPDWIFVLDRDAGTATDEGAKPARDVIDNAPSLQNVTAIVENQIVYAPNDTYTNESIQTFIEIFGILTDAFSK